MNNRLNTLAEEVDLITNAQAGFRKGHSTVDNIFVLHALITIYFALGKKLFCTFVDFKGAFDTVWRVGLSQKLQKSNIKGKIFKVVYNMYQNIKSCVKKGEEYSAFFNCDIGVKQGENMSPFLFSIFLNDLEEFFTDNDVENLSEITTLCQENIGMFVKIFVILYADDTVILSESHEGLQEALSVFEQYCTNWKLKVNTNKTKVVIFSKRKCKTKFCFKIYNKEIDILDSYSYLGIIFNYNGTFCTARKKLLDQAQKALYGLFTKIQNITIPIDLQLKLFDALVAPILLYSSEVWGFEQKSNIEKMHLQFCKRILKIRNTTPNFMVYGELGRFPLEILIKQKMVLYWNTLLCDNKKLSSIMYKLMFTLYRVFPHKFKWVSYVKSIFDELGLSYIWNDQLYISKNTLKLVLKQKLVDQFTQHWFSQIDSSSRGGFYSKFKNEFKLESYLLKLNCSERSFITKLRCSNLKLPIETGRWEGIERERRICHLCRQGIGNEFHYLFLCNDNRIKDFRERFIPKYYLKYPNENKMYGLLSICHVQVYKKLSLFLKNITKIL